MTEPALSIHTSNRLESLFERLARDLEGDPLPPLEREVVVVQSQGMHRWLTLALARRLGIAASLTAPFPRTFCHHLAEHLLEGGGWPASEDLSRPAPSMFARETLTWRLFALLEDLRSVELAPLAAYLADDPDQRKRFQLATRLAGLFDDYQLYRPEMTLAWERAGEPQSGASDEPAAWQARLWRRLVRGVDEDSLGRRLSRLIEHLQRAPGAPAGLPRRLAVFGVTTLPPVFVRLLAALARFIPVGVYFVSPTYHYWGDLRSQRETERIRARLRRRGEALEELHFEEGHPLLAALGRQGRDFFNLLQAADEQGAAWHELEFSPPASDSVLHRLQSDILHLADRATRPHALDSEDDSLTVHACHSPMREMEVVRDRILDAFARDPELTPGDVLVLVPDIAVYGPYVEAVFGVEHEGAPSLPFAVADRRAGEEQPPAETVLQVLDLVASRLAPGSVFDLLDVPAIRRRAGIAGHEVPVLRRWIDDTRVRWGMDGDQRGDDFDLPREEANTWRAGLDRLLMGYAAGDRAELVAGVLPHAGATAGNAELLGRLASFVDRLFAQLRALKAPRYLAGWARDLHRALDVLYQADGEAEERALLLVRYALDQLPAAPAVGGGEPRPVTREVVRAHLASRLADDGFGRGFLTGGITFGALKPMRTIPFEMICVAGLDDGAFPRRDPARTFDLMAADPRPGDRSLAADDRYLFLETLMAARRRLVLTFTGRSPRDGSEQPPSVVVAELLDHLDRTFAAPDGRPVRRHLLVEHRLQPWSPAYFDGRDRRLSSTSREGWAASRALVSGRAPEAPFIGRRAAIELAGGAPPGLDITVRELAELWVNPSRGYCRQVLQLVLEPGEAELEDAEPFTVDALAGYRLRQDLLDRRLRRDANERSAAEELALLRAAGELPLAGLGTASYALLDREVRDFVRDLPAHRPAESCAIELEGGGWRLGGQIDGLTDRGLLRYRLAAIKPKDLIRAWVAHVVWNAWAAGRRAAGRTPLETRVYGRERNVTREARFVPLAEPRSVLEALVDGYRKGLERPLPLFEEASYRFVDQRRHLADPTSRRRKSPEAAARDGWSGGEYRAADRDEPYVALCFRGRDPLRDESFATWAEYLWGPIFDHLERP